MIFTDTAGFISDIGTHLCGAVSGATACFLTSFKCLAVIHVCEHAKKIMSKTKYPEKNLVHCMCT